MKRNSATAQSFADGPSMYLPSFTPKLLSKANHMRTNNGSNTWIITICVENVSLPTQRVSARRTFLCQCWTVRLHFLLMLVKQMTLCGCVCVCVYGWVIDAYKSPRVDGCADVTKWWCNNRLWFSAINPHQHVAVINQLRSGLCLRYVNTYRKWCTKIRKYAGFDYNGSVEFRGRLVNIRIFSNINSLLNVR